MSTELDNKLDFWLEKGLNILLEGTQGVGKSTILEAAVKRAGLNCKYYTASLMDPYISLIGVPKEKVDPVTGDSHLEFIRPSEFSDEENGIEVIFFDEFNRAPASVRNATMELIQFRSINGKKLPNLKCIVAAINPYDDNETYNVFELDPAQKDRFHVHYVLPNEPSKEYFTGKFGAQIADAGIKWWRAIPEEFRGDISPRRLDYALDMYCMGGDVSDVLIAGSRPETLRRELQNFGAEISSTYTDRWLTDPETFLEEIASSTEPTEVDVIQAFAELKEVSMDQAVDYVAKLKAEQIKLIRDTEHVDILLRNFVGQQSATVTQALGERVWQTIHNDHMLDEVPAQTNAAFAKAFAKNNLDGMKKNAVDGFEYMVIYLWMLREKYEEDKLLSIIKELIAKKPAVIEFFAMIDHETVAKIYTH